MEFKYYSLSHQDKVLLDEARICCVNVHGVSTSGEDLFISIPLEQQFSTLNALDHVVKGLELLDIKKKCCEDHLYLSSGTHPLDFKSPE